jgi:ApbE superfamily uncharacterized protein (UPF0280 family)
MKQPRFYRFWTPLQKTLSDPVSGDSGLISYNVIVKETDLQIYSEKNLSREVLKLVLKYRSEIERYIEKNPDFLRNLKPLRYDKKEPEIVQEMLKETKKVKVGPMAAVAGAIADFVGREILGHTKEIIIENGGDIFLRIVKPKKIGIWCGERSKFKNKIVFEIDPEDTPLGICTSSAKVGPSLSFGNTDAATVITETATLADACATAVGNIVKKEEDIKKGIEFSKKVPGVKGVIIIIGDKMACWGKMRFMSHLWDFNPRPCVPTPIGEYFLINIRP